MPRYFFNLYHDVVAVDEEGTELPYLDAVRLVALRSARDLLSEDVKQGRIKVSHRIEVQDEDHRPVFTLPFSAAVQIEE